MEKYMKHLYMSGWAIILLVMSRIFMWIKKIVSKYIHYYERLKNTFSYHRLIVESEKGTLDNLFEQEREKTTELKEAK